MSCKLFRLVCVMVSCQLCWAGMVYGNGQRTEQNQLHRGRSSVLEIGPEVLQELSEEEREWYQRFQEGVLFFDGWSAISEELLAVFPEEEWRNRQTMMQRLGVKIGTEWAKKNGERKIDTGMLQRWGDRLRSARLQGTAAIFAALLAIEQEVDLLLQGRERLPQVSWQEW